MKWPNSVVFIRHGESAYNAIKKKKDESAAYAQFKERFEKEYGQASDEKWPSAELMELAKAAKDEIRLAVSDYETSLTEEGFRQAEETGKRLLENIDIPDIIYVSPYLRTKQTLDVMQKSCAKLRNIKVVFDERIREQEHGLSILYNDWRLYFVFNPAQALLFKLQGDYEYRYLNGENKADVRDRVRSFLSTLIREHAKENVLVVSHHLTLLSLRANLERWSREKFIEVDKNEKPINCGVTIYKGDPNQGKDGKLLLQIYNKKLF